MFEVLIALFSGILLALAFPGANISWLAWFTLAPLMYFACSLPWRRSLACGFAFGMGFFTVLIYWIGLFGKLPLVGLAIFQTFYIVAFSVAAGGIGRRLHPWGRLILLPSLWLGFEWLRASGTFGFTWGDLGYSQYRDLHIIQISSLMGIWGVSFLIALVNTAIALLIEAVHDLRKPSTALPYLAAAVVLVGITVGYGYVASQPSKLHVRKIVAAVAQGNVRQDTEDLFDYENSSLAKYRRLTMQASRKRADIVVWAETVVPGAVGTDPLIQRQLEQIAHDSGAVIVAGGWDEDGRNRVYNTAFLVHPFLGIVSRASKVHLVPFGEFVPVRKYLPFLKDYQVRDKDTTPGRGYHVMDTGEYRVGTAICFESAFPEIARELTASGANILCVLTDDEWFGNSPAAEQHLSKSVFRAIENGRYLLRGAATGESCIIDPKGHIICRKSLWASGILLAEVSPRSSKTFYTRHGDWLVLLSLVLSALVLPFARRKKLEDI